VIRLFTRHPKATGETYLQHLRFASLNGLKLMFSGFACIVHSIFPFIFTNTASNTVKVINQQMTARIKKSVEQNKNG